MGYTFYLPSDYAAITCNLHIARPKPVKMKISLRKLHDIDLDSFRTDILNSSPFFRRRRFTKELAPYISTQFSAEYIFSMAGPVFIAMNTGSGCNCTRRQFGSVPCRQSSGDYTEDFKYYIYSLENYSILYMAHFINQNMTLIQRMRLYSDLRDCHDCHSDKTTCLPASLAWLTVKFPGILISQNTQTFSKL